MNKYSRIFHHINVADVRRNHQHNIEVQKIEDLKRRNIELMQREDDIIFDRQKSNWRSELSNA